jgi:hypothetical protein
VWWGGWRRVYSKQSDEKEEVIIYNHEGVPFAVS